ncbi:hypothetical protein Plano_0543 [Planococcus sp. PAMC 21323]|uniref:DUF6119 family protein n=1 Tax=Planococcus sp. PAMC 21323 TaxID=1526927 RepID=UPI00058629E7|nr:DUF6119 family protein [Planococcus sp. PAMC 21323]AIY04508.1 hypothetical protein Plano_0543 [Planococcus sp. PAMC 21323]
MEFSIYRQLTRKIDLIQYLIEKGLQRVGNTQIHTSTLIIENEKVEKEVILDFFFKLDTEEIEINWANYWSNFFDGANIREKTIESAYGIIIFDIEGSIFTISLGRGHSLANNFADYDFGFDMAEILHDTETVEVKSSKFFKQTKSKSLTQYNANSYVTSEIGESNELLISKIKLAEKYSGFHLYSYRKKAKFGTAIKIEVDSYIPSVMIDVVHEISYLFSHEDKSGDLPRMIFLKNIDDNQYKISDLNDSLLSSLKSETSKVNLSYYIEDGGDILFNPMDNEEIEIVYNRYTYPLPSYSIDALSQLINDIECTDITKVSIRTISDRSNSKPLIKLLDYGVEYQRKDFYLYKGRWASFNKSYIEYIEREINKVNDCVVLMEEYNLTEEILRVGRDFQESVKNYV